MVVEIHFRSCLWVLREFSTTDKRKPVGTGGNSLTLMEAPANRASCLMCAPFFPMIAPTAWVGMKRLTVSCSGY